MFVPEPTIYFVFYVIQAGVVNMLTKLFKARITNKNLRKNMTSVQCVVIVDL